MVTTRKMSWILFGENVLVKKRKPIERYNLATIDSSLESTESGSLISFISDSQETLFNSNGLRNISIENLTDSEFAHFDDVDNRLKKTQITESCGVLNNNCADGLKTKENQLNLMNAIQYNHLTFEEKDKQLCDFKSISSRNIRIDNTFIWPSIKKATELDKNSSVYSLNELLNERNELLNERLLDRQLSAKFVLEELNKAAPGFEESFSSCLKKEAIAILNKFNMDTSSLCFDTSLDLSYEELISSRVNLAGPRQEWIKFSELDPPLVNIFDVNQLSCNSNEKESCFQNKNKNYESEKKKKFLCDESYASSLIRKRNDGEEIVLISDEKELEDEVISLDYESEEEMKKLSKGSITKYPNVSLFQASSVLKSKLLENTKEAFNLTEPIDIIDDTSGLNTNRTNWSFWYRYPDRARRLGRRKWIPVTVTFDNGFIKLNGSTKKGSEIFKEFPLHPFFVFTIPKVHRGNKDGHVHSVKLQYVKYKESRRIKSGSNIEHVPVYTPVLKLASRDLLSLREFLSEVERIIRQIPTYRSNMVSYRQEGLFIDCDDECNYWFSGDGKILQYSITVQLRLRTFISGNPYIRIFLNDANYKEVVIANSLIEDLRPPATWIEPQQYEYHPCVDTSNTEGGIKFLPPDGCSFELLRLRVRAKCTPPLFAMASVEILTDNFVRLKASLRVCGDEKSLHYIREDVLLYIPIPSSWSTMFIRSRSMRGFKKYLKVKATYKTGDAALATLNRVSLQVSVGRATYEPAFGALVWRLGPLPIIKGNKSTETVHTFQCQLEPIPFSIQMTNDFQPYAYVEFSVGHQIASGVIVHQVLVSDNKCPEKWICYRSNYIYKVSMKVLKNGKEVQK